MSITHNNHYVPRLYLKHFADADGFLHRYRTLVSNEAVRDWKRLNIAGVAYQRHLYTRAVVDGDSDEIEQWLAKDFENPAEESISKIVHGGRMSKNDYHLLTRFVAAQMVRTPAFFVKNVGRWKQEASKQSEESLKNFTRALEKSKATGIPLTPSSPFPNSKYYPIRITKEPSSDPREAIIKLQTMVGRATWVYAMRHILTQTVEKFNLHKWSIIHAEDNLPWFTTDDPVVALNFRSVNDYDFGGGWGVAHTNIFLPLSPKHLLFTQIGDKRPPNGTVFPIHQALLLRRMIAEHAHRYIFSPVPDISIAALRPRVIDANAVKQEVQLWNRWHSEQSIAEREFLKP